MLERGGYIESSGLPTPPPTEAMTAISAMHGRVSYPAPYYRSDQPALDSRPSYAPSTRPSTNHYETRSYTRGLSAVSNSIRPNEEQIATHLQIPESVNGSKGSLSEFAARITCLFWFETSDKLEYAENLPESAATDLCLNADAVPSIGFVKWVTTILSTTQVGRNVVLLALMFIHRLKKFNPSVSGKRGSEFRLLTIALMLGNKFLDDNTYTNKTWAEVSGISVNEIHIMEVEFLSNMRYELYASSQQWKEWKFKLNRFGSFYEKALACHTPPKASSPTTPTSQTMYHKLPSPTASLRHKGSYSTLPNPLHTMQQVQRSPAKPYPGTDYLLNRKRSLDTSLDMPPAKRIHSAMPNSIAALSPSVYTPQSSFTPDSASSALSFESMRLPQPAAPAMPMHPHQQMAPLSLPLPRAMSSVYPAANMVNNAPSKSLTLPSGHGMPSNIPPRLPSHAGSTNGSPTNLYGPATPTRPGLSPSYFLANRSSPYRPVRNVNTLLIPPPSTAMHNPIKSINFQQMQYQPLSKQANDVKLGPMPCLQPDAWASNVSTPIYRPY